MVKKDIKQSFELKKTFNYEKEVGGTMIKLNFTLNINKPEEMKVFSEMLMRGIEDINETITNNS